MRTLRGEFYLKVPVPYENEDSPGDRHILSRDISSLKGHTFSYFEC